MLAPAQFSLLLFTSPIQSQPLTSESNISTDTSPVQTFLLSPDIDTQDSAAYNESGFYMMRKDSERRQTMVRILEQDMDKICANWLTMLQRDKSITAPKLTVDHLACLLNGIKEYILNQNPKAIKGAIDTIDNLWYEQASHTSKLSRHQDRLSPVQQASHVGRKLNAMNIHVERAAGGAQTVPGLAQAGVAGKENVQTPAQVCEERYTLQDILELVTWEDLRELKIRGGMRCRIWRAILRQRTKDRDDG
ncbi:mitogen-activated protein kinase kinase kinase 5 [Plakobranchus ocellatus]|uniref:Mitogen-activated protein kinase kinase kinase 5 n=1 Tax=Plakobranchus ocellatus TaxID=259542 RepID=A0AAV4CWW9_9GAST|nr:mitogen-activated protein kinase kinase kinase 5 [Plakobranchus ocellatus]